MEKSKASEVMNEKEYSYEEDTDELNCLTEKQAARYINMSASFLRAARTYGDLPGRTKGPHYLRYGRAIRYLKSDLDDWLRTRRVIQRELKELLHR